LLSAAFCLSIISRGALFLGFLCFILLKPSFFYYFARSAWRSFTPVHLSLHFKLRQPQRHIKPVTVCAVIEYIWIKGVTLMCCGWNGGCNRGCGGCWSWGCSWSRGRNWCRCCNWRRWC
jgi:hypothetical protein